jgi:hypothetical protein
MLYRDLRRDELMTITAMEQHEAGVWAFLRTIELTFTRADPNVTVIGGPAMPASAKVNLNSSRT